MDDKQELIIRTIHLEYTVLRTELRTNWVFVIFSISMAVLIPLIGLMISDFITRPGARSDL